LHKKSRILQEPGLILLLIDSVASPQTAKFIGVEFLHCS
jgi:hypothetical protein